LITCHTISSLCAILDYIEFDYCRLLSTLVFKDLCRKDRLGCEIERKKMA
jgi:hypothetical protein